MNIVLLGSGHTATVLGRKLLAAGHNILQVWSRDPAHARVLSHELNSSVLTNLENIVASAELCIIAIPDAAIGKLTVQLPQLDMIVAHTAGAVSKEVLKKTSAKYGVFYPLQTLRKEQAIISEIPLLVDGNTNEVVIELEKVAKSISGIVRITDDKTRLQLHLAAVLAGNFSNHLFALTEIYCKDHHLDFQLLMPIITEIVSRLKSGNAAQLQTGPALRDDRVTLQQHMDLLKNEPSLQHLYQILSESIAAMYHKKPDL